MKNILSSASCLGLLILFSPVVRGQDVLTPPRVAGVPAVSADPATPVAPAAKDTVVYSGLVNSPLRFGLGLNVGNLVTGVTAKLWASSAVAFQTALGEGPDGNNIRWHLDMVFSAGTWTSSDSQYVLPFYIGVGGVFDHQFAAGQNVSYSGGGFRVPMGMSVLVHGNPIELFFEIAPEFTVRGNSNQIGKYVLNIDGSIGARYFF